MKKKHSDQQPINFSTSQADSSTAVKNNLAHCNTVKVDAKGQKKQTSADNHYFDDYIFKHAVWSVQSDNEN
jgi:hypothetical protein